MTFAPEDTKATNMPGMTGMAKAYERWVNSKGGLNGHKLRVLTCNEKNTPTGAADCARKAVAEKAVAVIGSYSQHGRAFMAPLEAEGIPFIGGYGVSSEEFQSPLSYPVNGGQSVLIAGAGHQLGRACDQVALVRPDTIAGDTLPVLLNAGLRANKMADAADIRAAEDSADFGPQAREALTHTSGTGKEKEKEKGCVTAVLGERTETFRRLRRPTPSTGSWTGGRCWVCPAESSPRKSPSNPSTAGTGGMYCVAASSCAGAAGTGGMYWVAASSCAGAAGTGGMYCVAASSCAAAAGTGGMYWVAASGSGG
ncbi:ABC transporter substrate-binding protein [Streptomyces avidinii]